MSYIFIYLMWLEGEGKKYLRFGRNFWKSVKIKNLHFMLKIYRLMLYILFTKTSTFYILVEAIVKNNAYIIIKIFLN
jgi:hypothetical protein